MNTHLFFYTGTGNSLWTARRLAGELGDTELHPIAKTDSAVPITPEGAVGLVFPVHMWGVPRRVLQFINMLPADPRHYYFAVAVNGGQVATTLLQLHKVMQRKGMSLSAGYDLVTPSNYIPWGSPGPEEKWKERLTRADEKIRRIARDIAQRKTLPVEKGPRWQNILFPPLYRMSFGHVREMDKSFYSDGNCNSCGICERICPAKNIVLHDGKPGWKHQCEQCLACIQWCPQEAIQFGKKTAAYPRYHHPEVKLADIIAGAPDV